MKRHEGTRGGEPYSYFSYGGGWGGGVGSEAAIGGKRNRKFSGEGELNNSRVEVASTINSPSVSILTF